jgi:ion channel-forming bestrophin family protein
MEQERSKVHTGKRFGLKQTLRWSERDLLFPMAYAMVVVTAYDLVGLKFLSIPTLPMSLIGVGVAFYLGFKNNASYDRLWEARKIWGAIVNASRSWAYSTRDLITTQHGGQADEAELEALRAQLVHRHVAWMDALRHQLRRVQPWEHTGAGFDALRLAEGVVEYSEDLAALLTTHIGEEAATRALSQLNPAAHLLSEQSRQLAALRSAGLLDAFAHMHLQELLQDLMAEQGKAERIKNFPLPRQYATVNTFFASLFSLLLPFGLIPEFAKLGEHMVWLSVPFSAVVSWVFLTTDRIGEWSENPFEGLANDVPITTMSRGIERDMRQLIGEADLPPARPASGNIQY